MIETFLFQVLAVFLVLTIRGAVVTWCYLRAIVAIQKILADNASGKSCMMINLNFWLSRVTPGNEFFASDVVSIHKWTPRQFFPSLYMWEA